MKKWLNPTLPTLRQGYGSGSARLRWMRWVLVSIGALITLFFILMFQPWALLPHKHIEISLPFAPEDDATTGLIPMGEMIEHNASNGNSDGHAGIDFGFEKVTAILSVADGRVTRVAKNSEGSIDVEISSGFYKITYKEMNSVESQIKFFAKVTKGEKIGYSGLIQINFEKPKLGDPSRQIHWEFSSASMAIDRLCPVNYFDADSKARIERIWAAVPANDQFKKLYPDICNGVFKGKED